MNLLSSILLFLSFSFLIDIVYVSITNVGTQILLQPFGITLNFALYTAIIAILGLLMGAIWVGHFYFSEKCKLGMYKRELEKSSISDSSNKSKVEVLEAKIATLEKALQDALNK